MGLHIAVVTTLCLIILVMMYSQIELTAADSSRDYLFIKPRNFVKQRAEKNKTRFTDEEKWMILQIHNSYRSIVEPSAADMRELVWDNDLEDYAWNHTQACTGAHSAGTMLKKWIPDQPLSWRTWTSMGENLYYSYAPWYSVEEALWMFWAEGLDYDIATDNCTNKQTCGHYRVLVLAASSRIGCAMNTCNKFSASSYPTPAIFISCSYDGKYIIYYRPYTVGERGSHCTYDLLGSDFEYCRYGLCISNVMNYFKTGFDGNTSIVGLPPNYLTSTTTSTISTTFASDTTTISMEYLNTTTEAYTTAETYVTTRGETTTGFTVTTPMENFSTPSSPSISTTGYFNETQTTFETTTFTFTTESFTTLSSPSTESSTTLFTGSTESSTALFTGSTESSTSLFTGSTESSTSLSIHTTGTSTQEEVITSTHPPTSTKRTSKKRTVSHAAGLCVWVSHLILLLLVYVLASLQ